MRNKEALPVGPTCQRGEHFFAKYGGLSGGSQQSGGKRFLAKYGGPSSGSKQPGGNVFSRNTGAPFGGSLLSGGGINIFHVIRRHFLAAAVDPVASLSMYSTLPMEVGR